MSERYSRDECGCVEIVDVDARSVTHVPCPAHRDDIGSPAAESCPACDDDGKPCALCNPNYAEEMCREHGRYPDDSSVWGSAQQPDPFDDLMRRCEREGYDCRITTMRDGVRVMLIADGRSERRFALLSELMDVAKGADK